MRSFGRTAVLATAVAAMSMIAAQPAEAVSVYPDDHPNPWLYPSYGTHPEGVAGDGTIGNDSWRVTTNSSHKTYISNVMFSDGMPDFTIRDIVHMSVDTKRNGGYGEDDFMVQFEVPEAAADIFFATYSVDGASDFEAEDGDFAEGEWNTYEWNMAGNGDGLEGSLHQNEVGGAPNNPWLTLSEMFTEHGDESADDYNAWLDMTVDGINIVGYGSDSNEFNSQIDNFTFTYDLGNDAGPQTTVVDFKATVIPTPAAVGVGLIGFAGMLLRRPRPRNV